MISPVASPLIVLLWGYSAPELILLPLPATADQQERLPWACSQTAGRSRGDALEPCSLDMEGKQVGWAGAAGMRGYSCPLTGKA